MAKRQKLKGRCECVDPDCPAHPGRERCGYVGPLGALEMLRIGDHDLGRRVCGVCATYAGTGQEPG